MKNFLCFGELLLRLSPQLQGKWIKTASMPVFLGGAELNVARALAMWNLPTKYYTHLPDHYLSKEIVAALLASNINVSAICYDGKRIGTYYLPQGADLKDAGVIYDREGSSFSEIKPGNTDWEKVLADCSWFHFSAISPALNQNVATTCKEVLQVAKKMGITVSVDLNYRAKLWQYGKQPVSIMGELLPYCDVVMGNLWSAESLLGITSLVHNSDGKTKEELAAAAAESMLQMHQQYPQVQTIAYTFRLEKSYWAVLQHGPDREISKEQEIKQVVDRSGSGDCFMAALIYGFSKFQSNEERINFAVSAAIAKLTEKGDAISQTVTQIQNRER